MPEAAAVALGLVGCGGMRRRHLYGLAEPQRTLGRDGRPALVSLVAVTDREPRRANEFADEADRERWPVSTARAEDL